MSFLGELKRRKVFQVAALYAVVAWLLVQIIVSIEEPLRLPAWTDTFVIICLAVGFPIALIMSWAFDMTPDGLVREQSNAQSSPTRGRGIEYALIGGLIVAVAFLIVDNYVLNGTAEAVVEAERADDVLQNSVAVLPLENLSPDPDNAYFAAGMHEEILNHLAKLRNLNVISRTSVLGYAENRPPIPRIADELNVEVILEGSVRFDGDSVLVTAQLIDGATDTHLWSERYERRLAGVFAVQADIARNVANALQATFSPAEQDSIEREPTTSPEAYALYLRAMSDQPTTVEKHELLDRALALDPDFALAYGAKSWLYSQALASTSVATGVVGEGRPELEELVREYADRALSLDPGTGTAHAALASFQFFYWHWTDALQSFEQAMASAPGGVQTLSAYVFLNSYLGNHDEAIRLARQLVRLNPNSAEAFSALGLAQGYARDYDEASTSFRLADAIASDAFGTAFWVSVEVARGNETEALRLLDERYTERVTGVFAPAFAHLYARLGRTDFADRVLARLQAEAADGQEVSAGTFAQAYIAAGQYDRGLEWLEVAAEKAANHEPDEGFYPLMALKMNSNADPVLERPEFVDVRARIAGD